MFRGDVLKFTIKSTKSSGIYEQIIYKEGKKRACILRFSRGMRENPWGHPRNVRGYVEKVRDFTLVRGDYYSDSPRALSFNSLCVLRFPAILSRSKRSLIFLMSADTFASMDTY